MTPRSALTWASGTFLLLALLVATTGCGGGGGPYYEPIAGTLEVHNSIDSFEEIVDIEVSDEFGPYYAFFSNQFVFPGESWFLGLYPSDYEVTLYWSDFLVETYFISIFDDLTTTIIAQN